MNTHVSPLKIHVAVSNAEWFLIGAGGWLVLAVPFLYFRDVYRRPCAICRRRPNVRKHACHVKAGFKAVGEVKIHYGSMGVLPKTLWAAAVRDGRGILWNCDHRHHYRHKALKCAARAHRRVQFGRIPVDDVIAKRPKARTYVARVPVPGLSAQGWKRMMSEAGHRCAYCQGTFRPEDLEREHAIPLARDGQNDLSNIVVSCCRCNRRKGTLTDSEFRQLLEKEQRRGLP